MRGRPTIAACRVPTRGRQRDAPDPPLCQRAGGRCDRGAFHAKGDAARARRVFEAAALEPDGSSRSRAWRPRGPLPLPTDTRPDSALTGVPDLAVGRAVSRRVTGRVLDPTEGSAMFPGPS